MCNVSSLLLENAKRIEERMQGMLAPVDKDTAKLWEAMRYSALSGGKRVRPFITVEVAKMLGGDLGIAEDFGIAIELVHTYSLIHDDLPCMDDDDFRRGRLTTHKKFGEATAVLAGDALLTLAFDIILKSKAIGEQKLAAIAALSEASGAYGMIGGQIMDLSNLQKRVDTQTLYKLHRLKTGALLTCAAKLGCIAAGRFAGDAWNAAVSYADDIGLVFQIVDDILDEFGTVAIGKPMHSDEEKGKATVLTIMTLDEAKKAAEELTARAVSTISALPGSDTLIAFGQFLLSRQK